MKVRARILIPNIDRGFLLALLIVLVPVSFAQESSTNEVVARMTKALHKTKSVVVFDFVGPDASVTALGRELAAGLRTGLAKASPNLKVATVAEMNAAFAREKTTAATATPLAGTTPQQYAPVANPEDGARIAETLNAQTLILGNMWVEDNNLIVEIECYRRKREEAEAVFRTEMPLTEDQKAFLVHAPKWDPFTDNPSSTTKGYSQPACRYCPGPTFTDGAVRDHINGTVELLVVISAGGRPQEMRVLRGLPDGLTDMAVQTVRSWRFQPANGPNGKPATVVTPVEVTFRMLGGRP